MLKRWNDPFWGARLENLEVFFWHSEVRLFWDLMKNAYVDIETMVEKVKG